MGFTAVDGLMMGTRTGSLDPGVLLYLMQERGLDAGRHRGPALPPVGPARRVGHLVGHAHPAAVHGTRGGRSGRPVRLPHRARGRARWRPRWAALDAIVFTAGIGEHDAVAAG